MFIITNKKELAIWLTEKPFDKKSGVWHFYQDEFEYNYDLELFIEKYSKHFMFTLSKIKKLYKDRGETDADKDDTQF